MNPNRHRAILAAQKIRVKTDPVPTPEAPKLTAEQRREMYAPKSALEIIPKRPPMTVRAAKSGGVLLGMLGAISLGILAGETKRGLRS
jgi:hypothetical protein